MDEKSYCERKEQPQLSKLEEWRIEQCYAAMRQTAMEYGFILDSRPYPPFDFKCALLPTKQEQGRDDWRDK